MNKQVKIESRKYKVSKYKVLIYYMRTTSVFVCVLYRLTGWGEHL